MGRPKNPPIADITQFRDDGSFAPGNHMGRRGRPRASSFRGVEYRKKIQLAISRKLSGHAIAELLYKLWQAGMGENELVVTAANGTKRKVKGKPDVAAARTVLEYVLPKMKAMGEEEDEGDVGAGPVSYMPNLTVINMNGGQKQQSELRRRIKNLVTQPSPAAARAASVESPESDPEPASDDEEAGPDPQDA